MLPGSVGFVPNQVWDAWSFFKLLDREAWRKVICSNPKGRCLRLALRIVVVDNSSSFYLYVRFYVFQKPRKDCQEMSISQTKRLLVVHTPYGFQCFVIFDPIHGIDHPNISQLISIDTYLMKIMKHRHA